MYVVIVLIVNGPRFALKKSWSNFQEYFTFRLESFVIMLELAVVFHYVQEPNCRCTKIKIKKIIYKKKNYSIIFWCREVFALRNSDGIKCILSQEVVDHLSRSS